MFRRSFVTSSLLAPALVSLFPRVLRGLQTGSEAGSAENSREYYVLRHYELSSGPSVKLAHSFFQDALIPAANRLGIRPIGAFSNVVGPNSPTLHILLPSASLETLVRLDSRLAADSEYLKTGAPFLEAPAATPAYNRMESSLMIAFEGWPRIQAPASALSHSRIFELRTYESPSDRDHARKVEMFNSGEFEIFHRAGFRSVFFGDTLVGSRMPNLTYMLAFDDLGERDKLWSAFGSLPEWKKLSGSSRYAFEEIVSSITNVILSPTAYSQI